MLRAGLLADGWDGNEYTNRAVRKEAQGVEELITADDETHGHHEKQIALFMSDDDVTLDERKMAELGLPDLFIVDLKATKKMAQELAGIRGKEGYDQAVIANIAFTVAVASVLCGEDMPISLFKANYALAA